MGRARMVYINDDLYEMLAKEENASQLINSLLRDYYKNFQRPELTPEQIRRQIELLEQMKELNEQLKEAGHDGIS